jgi:Uma2 family endonuclease
MSQNQLVEIEKEIIYPASDGKLLSEMSQNQLVEIEKEIIYPDSDGKPMADNTKQFDWITNIVYNLRTQFRHDPNVFIAGDLLWYPVKGDEKRRAPDVMIAFGRPRGHRGSYKQWLENGIAPQVVFEIRSPGNTNSEMEEKFQFYQNYLVEEYYLYDPDKGQLKGWCRGGGKLRPVVPMQGWKSKRLGIRFELKEKELFLYHPDDSPFTTHTEEANRASEEARACQLEKQRADKEARACQLEKQRAEREAKRASEEARVCQLEKQRAEREAKRAEMAEMKLARLQTLLAEKGFSLDDDDIFAKSQ